MKQQLEQNLEMYKPLALKERVFVVGDLERLSAIVLYGSGPSGPGAFNSNMLDFSEVPDLSRQFSYMDSFSSPKKEEDDSLRVESGLRGIKLFLPGVESPAVRLDFNSMHGLPEKHLQYGEKEYTGRYGDEAADLIADVLRKTKLKW